jgi:hypothetical protein
MERKDKQTNKQAVFGVYCENHINLGILMLKQVAYVVTTLI